MLVRHRIVFIRSHVLLVAMGVSFVLSMAATFAAASKITLDVPTEQQYRPIQSISYHLGSKRAVEYFTRENGECQVTMIVAEAVEPEVTTTSSAARLRLALRPGQAAGFDSEEGDSIDMTCGEAAETFTVHRSTWTKSDLSQNSQAAH